MKKPNSFKITTARIISAIIYLSISPMKKNVEDAKRTDKIENHISVRIV